MGKSTKHILEHNPGVSHHIQSNKGTPSPMPEAKAANDVPHIEGGASAHRGNRAEGPRANIAPSMDGDCYPK